MEYDPTDDMMFLCASDGSLALTGRELRERRNDPRGDQVSPVDSLGRVLHAWDLTDRRGAPEVREYTTTQGALVSDGEVVAPKQAFAEVRPVEPILTASQLKSRAREAAEETSHGGLKRSYSQSDLNGLIDNAQQIADFTTDNFSINLSLLFTGTWENAKPYLVGQDYAYRVPIKGEQSSFESTFKNAFSNIEQFNNQQIKLMWDAVTPEMTVNLDLYIEGELVSR